MQEGGRKFICDDIDLPVVNKCEKLKVFSLVSVGARVVLEAISLPTW